MSHFSQVIIVIIQISDRSGAMQTSRQPVDYFKVYKVLDLKKLDKQGEVKLVQDKQLGRKVLSVEGNVSTQNYITFDSAEVAKTQPNLSFSQRYLYIMGYAETGKHFCFQLTLEMNSKAHRYLFSTVYKQPKTTPQGITQMPLQIKTNRWTTIVVDLYDLCDTHTKQVRLSLRLLAVEVRASSKVKNMYLSDNLYDGGSLPRDMEMPLRAGENYYAKYGYVVVGGRDTLEKGRENSINVKNVKEEQISEAPKSQIPKQREPIKKAQSSKISHSRPTKAPPKPAKQPSDHSQLLKNLSLDDPSQQMPMTSQLPRPKTTIQASLYAIEGRSLSCNGVVSLQAFIVSPAVFAVHKSIKCMSLHRKYCYRLAVGYSDGSICIWDLVRQKSLAYFKTELAEVRQIELVGEGEQEMIFMVGQDPLRRPTILIATPTEILFKQISTYPITGFLVAAGQTILTYGFENIRLWKLNPHNHIITGVGLYLGKLNRKVTYTHACLLDGGEALVVDTAGYVTKVSVQEERVQQMKRVAEAGLDVITVVPEIGHVLVGDSNGVLKVLNYDLQPVEQLQLGARIRNISYSLVQSQPILQLDHHCHSLARLNLSSSSYSFVSRQHSQPLTHLCYLPRLAKLVSLSLDNSIRIWSLASNADHSLNKLPFNIKQEYQFVISNGQVMSALGHGNDRHVYVGFRSGVVRKVDVVGCEIVGEAGMAVGGRGGEVQAIAVSGNNQRVLVCVAGGEGGGYVLLADAALKIVYKFDPPPQYRRGELQCRAGFSTTHKQLYISWSYGSTHLMQIYSLQPQLLCEFPLQSAPAWLLLSDCLLQCLSSQPSHSTLSMHSIPSGQLLRLTNLPCLHPNKYSLAQPLLVLCAGNKQQLQIRTVDGRVAQCVDMPQSVSNISVGLGEGGEGVVVCGGDRSCGLYVVGVRLRGWEGVHGHEGEGELGGDSRGEVSCRAEESELELECIESKQVQFEEQSVREEKVEQPRQLQSLYSQQQQLYLQCQPYLLPPQPQPQPQHCQQLHPHNTPLTACNPLQLIFGWQVQYPAGDSPLLWFPQLQSTVFLLHRCLILHHFHSPIHQKCLHLPVTPQLLVQLGDKYIAVGMGNQLRLYSPELALMRTFTAHGTTVEACAMTNCEGYLIVVSTSTLRTYIQLIDIVTSSILCSTYTPAPLPSPRLAPNPHHIGIQFILYTPTQVWMYRLSSILTLQVQELEEMGGICSEVGDLQAIEQVRLGQEELVIMAMDRGVVLVDGRSGGVMMVCRGVVKEGVLGMRWGQDEGAGCKLVLLTQTNILYEYSFEASLPALVEALSTQRPRSMTTDTPVTLASPIRLTGQDCPSMLLITKSGTLWLVDLTDCSTIKVLSIHTGDPEHCITACILDSEHTIISGGVDGTVKLTSLGNLEQVAELYRPRREVSAIVVGDGVMLVGYGLEVCFYGVGEGLLGERWRYMGVVNLATLYRESAAENGKPATKTSMGSLGRIVSIRHIPYSDNYLICTCDRLVMLHHQKVLSLQTSTLKVQLKQLYNSLQQPQDMQVYGYNHILVREPGKITTWLRKEQRGVSTLQQLAQVEELTYYMLDVYQVEARDCLFVGQAKEQQPREYVLAVGNRLIWRDFNQHIVVRELEMGVASPRVLRAWPQGGYIIGDEEGAVWQVGENGLTGDKVKVFEGGIQGIEVGVGRVLVYGPAVAVLQL